MGEEPVENNASDAEEVAEEMVIGTTESNGAEATVEATEAVEAPDAVEASEAVEARKAAEAPEAIEASEAVAASEAVEALEAIDALEAFEVTEGIDAAIEPTNVRESPSGIEPPQVIDSTLDIESTPDIERTLDLESMHEIGSKASSEGGTPPEVNDDTNLARFGRDQGESVDVFVLAAEDRVVRLSRDEERVKAMESTDVLLDTMKKKKHEDEADYTAVFDEQEEEPEKAEPQKESSQTETATEGEQKEKVKQEERERQQGEGAQGKQEQPKSECEVVSTTGEKTQTADEAAPEQGTPPRTSAVRFPKQKYSTKSLDAASSFFVQKSSIKSMEGGGSIFPLPKYSVKSMDGISSRSLLVGARRWLRKKESGFQKSIAYDFGPRFREDDDLKPSGDFGVEEIPVMRYYPYLGDDEEESFEEVSTEEEEEIVTIDRDQYFERYDELDIELEKAKIESNLLQRKLAVFFRRRRLEQVLKESEQQPYDNLQKYHKLLDDFSTVTAEAENMRKSVIDDLNKLKNNREQKLKELDKLFSDMQQREKEIGMGLINTKTGHPIPDKLVERLINRQRIAMQQVAALRLKYIILKVMVGNKHEAIAEIDNVGEGLRLRDYEQLKVENRSHADKIEEREEELTRLRFKCQNTIQILAHIREKSSALEVDIDELKDEMRMAEYDSQQARENLNELKIERDQTRLAINKLRMESGVLAEPTLLRDMESSMKELAQITAEVEQLKTENKMKAQHIRNIRKHIEIASEEITRSDRSKHVVEKKKKPTPRVMRGRPSICKPTLPTDAFDHLRDKQPHRSLPKRSSFK